MGVEVKKRKHNAQVDSDDIQAAVDTFGQKYHCDACNKDITHLIIIRCAICSDFDLCVTCFASGFERADHKRDHDYRIIDVLDFPIFEADWGADEEILLVEGLELFGLGNWETIADHIVTKNSQQVGEHYEKIYVKSSNWPYPDMENHFEMRPGMRSRARTEGYEPPKLVKPPRAPASTPVNHDIAGYMPGRGEFEYEYENDADQIVKDLEFLEDDSKEDTALKCAVMDVYNTTLDRRQQRKSFVFSRGFTEIKKILNVDKRRGREEKELHQKYRVFAKMQTAEEFDTLMEGLIAENKLRAEVAKYQEYLRMGISTMKEGQEYDRQKSARASKLQNVGQGDKNFPYKRSVHNVGGGVGGGGGGEVLDSPGSAVARGGSATLNSIMPRKNNLLDVEKSDGYDLLIEEEKFMCANLRLYPRAYLGIKDIILREYSAKGAVKKRMVRSMIKIDVNKTSKLFDFFELMGWISS